jgi:hypothetical protein
MTLADYTERGNKLRTWERERDAGHPRHRSSHNASQPHSCPATSGAVCQDLKITYTAVTTTNTHIAILSPTLPPGSQILEPGHRLDSSHKDSEQLISYFPVGKRIDNLGT